MHLHLAATLPAGNYRWAKRALQAPKWLWTNTCTRLSPGVVEYICEAVGRRHAVSPEELLSRARTRRVAWARQEAYHRLRALHYSLPEIGRAFERDHSTVLLGVRAHEKRCLSPAVRGDAHLDRRGSC